MMERARVHYESTFPGSPYQVYPDGRLEGRKSLFVAAQR